ncbi:hypothetical protein SIID45300_02087 [Candidatus Magnetaquicoccaceae bacterium FCR-1]|uniref:DUF3124 domain-containing protein n=1 Tax=Candidatus Magnetaquiglobus chichijimensis TaxID=3141448 RepID=A0ABQ0CAM3_9PROT
MPNLKPVRTFALLLTLSFAAPTSLLRADDPPPLSAGQTLYVPTYSSVWHGNLNDRGRPSEILLSVMLSMRNTDPKYSLTLTSVKYYDTAGKLLREYLQEPRTLGPMGTVAYFVEHQDREGGTGANFVVTWRSERPINQPIAETVQVYHWGTQAKAFISRGQAIHPHE